MPRSQRIRASRKGRPCNELGLAAQCLLAASRIFVLRRPVSQMIWDPATGLDHICDLAVSGDRIAAVGTGLASQARNRL